MKLSESILIVIMAYSSIYLGIWGFYEFENANNSVVGLNMYSDYEFNQKNLEDLYIVQFNEDSIQDYPVLLELITQNQSKEPPVNSFSTVFSTFEEVKKETEYFASKFLKKYSGSLPEDIYSIGKGNSKYTISLKEIHFIYDDTNYLIFPDTVYFKKDMGKMGIMNAPANFQLGDSLVITLTDEDFEQMPRYKKVLDQVGTLEKSTRSEKKMSESEFKKYEQLAIDIGLADERTVFSNAVIEFQNRHYAISLRP